MGAFSLDAGFIIPRVIFAISRLNLSLLALGTLALMRISYAVRVSVAMSTGQRIRNRNVPSLANVLLIQLELSVVLDWRVPEVDREARLPVR